MAKQAYVLIDGAWVATGGPPGATGPQGPAGPPGADGVDGIDGGAGGGSPLSSHASFTYQTAITETIASGMLRLNNAVQTSATKIWVSQITTDSLDIAVGLERCLIGNEVYIQAFDDSSKWLIFAVTADAIDKGTYFEIGGVVRSTSGVAIPAGPIEIQRIGIGQVGIPKGGAANEVLKKSTTADYDVVWGAASSSGHTIQNEGTALTARAGLNFLGDTVNVTDNSASNRTDVTINTPNIIVIGPTDPVPAGTPAGTIVLRTP